MSHPRLLISTLLAMSLISHAAPVPAPAGLLELPLWKESPPATPTGNLPDESAADAAHTQHVSTPRLWLSLPDNPNKNKLPVVILMPGGGYGVVGHQYEGTEVATYLKTRGIASAVLIYRCSPQLYPAPLLDARRAMQLLRERATEWNLDPHRTGVMGFSAGGHLAGLTCSGVTTTPASTTTARPDFAVLVYPVVRLRGPLAHAGSGSNLLGNARVDAEAPALALDGLVDAHWPTTFILHDKDDPGVPSNGSVTLSESLEKQKIPHQTHIVPGHDHGFGWNRPGPDGKIRGPKDWLPQAADWILTTPKK